MPVVSGKEAFNQVIKIRDNIPILVSSGFSEDSISDFAHYDLLDFLHKPYTLDILREKMNALLKRNKIND